MPPLTIPPELKKITAFIRRAEELDNDKTQATSRLIAYYCRQWAVELSLPILKTSTDPLSKSTLLSIMSSLETEKSSVGDAFTKVEAYTVCRDFAQKVLSSADASYASVYALSSVDYPSAKNCARSYFAAGVFFDVLAVFENASVEEAIIEKDDISSRRKYAKWRASLILSASKNGEELPEPVVEDNDETKSEDNKSVADYKPSEEKYDVDIPPAPTGSVGSTEEVKESTPPPVYSPDPVPARSSWFSSKSDKGKPSKASVSDAIELTKFAMKALEEKEIEIARERLMQALECLK
ncbi:hypothetical protein TrVE_jg8505 [Triparma verrucosa]|uniref:Vta1/callose synthase N-terminal domain-containing protein n=2 Tax=Triparma TaxID=722752 RepID=A0A9W7A2S0_9STRA|nr:hypothetical protein TrST_g10112 [Triparma strigata]GMI00184.1 hypothetical protein TrVE_jg8505 [Triparma verrucosa]